MPTELRDEIARLADVMDTTMQEVVAEAVRVLGRDKWWSSVHEALDDLDEQEVGGYQAEAKTLEAASPDGLDGA
ncbi:MAG: hypothetical protein OXT07_12225 [bacterium]|nr:hypothetical protein [bacterium]